MHHNLSTMQLQLADTFVYVWVLLYQLYWNFLYFWKSTHITGKKMSRSGYDIRKSQSRSNAKIVFACFLELGNECNRNWFQNVCPKISLGITSDRCWVFRWQGAVVAVTKLAMRRLYDKGSLTDPHGNGRLGLTIVQDGSAVDTNMRSRICFMW